jgi:hypothetical protein
MPSVGYGDHVGRIGPYGDDVMLHDYYGRPFATSRRKAWPRILSWIVAATPFCLLMAMVLWGDWILALAKG